MAWLTEVQAGSDQERSRLVPRRKLSLSTEARPSRDGAVQAIIRDMSETGLLIEADLRLDIGDRLELELPERGPVEAQVMWSSGRHFGCQFATPLARAAVSAAVLRSSPRSSDKRPHNPTGIRVPSAEFAPAAKVAIIGLASLVSWTVVLAVTAAITRII